MTRARHPWPGRLPQRSCVACRQVRAKSELVRIVRTPQGEVRLDTTGKLAGRGAYICADLRCLEQAVKQGKLNRALARPLSAEVVEMVRQSLAGNATELGEKRTANAGA